MTEANNQTTGTGEPMVLNEASCSITDNPGAELNRSKEVA